MIPVSLNLHARFVLFCSVFPNKFDHQRNNAKFLEWKKKFLEKKRIHKKMRKENFQLTLADQQ